jgi:hypothetical protein
MVRTAPNASNGHRRGSIDRALLATCVAVFATGNAFAASTTVFKCFDRALGVLYTDQPCKGEQMNIQVTDANPAAIAELQRERDALARSTAQRIADSQRASLEKAYAVPYAYPPEQGVGAYTDGVGYPYGYGVAPYSTPKRMHAAATHSGKQLKRQRFISIPPPVFHPR